MSLREKDSSIFTPKAPPWDPEVLALI